jgi:hypothetical protein
MGYIRANGAIGISLRENGRHIAHSVRFSEIEPLFGSADGFAARAPVSSSSGYLLYADQPLRIPGLSKATFLVPAPHALRDHSKCSFFVDCLPNRDGLVDTPLVVPAVAALTDDFKIRITIVNLSEKTTTIPHLQAVASLNVRSRFTTAAMATRMACRARLKESLLRKSSSCSIPRRLIQTTG